MPVLLHWHILLDVIELTSAFEALPQLIGTSGNKGLLTYTSIIINDILRFHCMFCYMYPNGHTKLYSLERRNCKVLMYYTNQNSFKLFELPTLQTYLVNVCSTTLEKSSVSLESVCHEILRDLNCVQYVRGCAGSSLFWM